MTILSNFCRLREGVLQSVMRIRKNLNVDLGPAFHVSADPDPDPDPGSQINADPDPGPDSDFVALLEVKVDNYI
jgi:hypothetical protein